VGAGVHGVRPSEPTRMSHGRRRQSRMAATEKRNVCGVACGIRADLRRGDEGRGVFCKTVYISSGLAGVCLQNDLRSLRDHQIQIWWS
jgi:hypothetical protein